MTCKTVIYDPDHTVVCNECQKQQKEVKIFFHETFYFHANPSRANIAGKSQREVSSEVRKIFRKKKNVSYPLIHAQLWSVSEFYLGKFCIPTNWMMPYFNHLGRDFLAICTPISSSLIFFLSSVIFLSLFSLTLILSRPNDCPMWSRTSSISSLPVLK